MSPADKIFQAGKEAMRAIVGQFPSGSERPEWVVSLINAIGMPSDLAKVCELVEADAQDAERWRSYSTLATVDAEKTLFGLVEQVQLSLGRNLEPGGPNDRDTLAEVTGLLDCVAQREAMAQAQRDAVEAELWRFLLRTINPENREGQIMMAIGEEEGAKLMGLDESPTGAADFAQCLATGLARFKAETH